MTQIDDGYYIKLGATFDPSGLEQAQAAVTGLAADISSVFSGPGVQSVDEYFRNLGQAAQQFGEVSGGALKGAFEGAADAVKATASGISEMINEVGGAFGPLGASIAEAFTNPLALAASAVTAFAAASLEAWQSMDSGLDAITIKTGLIGEELDKMSQSMVNVLPNVTQGSAEVGAVMGDLVARTGASGEALEKLSTQYLHLAELTSQRLNPLIEQSSRLFAKWKIDVDGQGEAMDKLFVVMQRTGTNYQSLSDYMLKFGATLQQLGYNFDTSAQMIGKLHKSGADVTVVLNGMKMALTKLAESGHEPIQGFQDLITTLQSVDKTTGDMLLKQAGITKGFAEFSEAARNGKLDWDQFAGGLDNAKGAIDRTRSAIADYPELFKQLRNEMTPVLKMFGTEMAQSLGELAVVLKPAAEYISTAAKAFGSLDAQAKGFFLNLIPGIANLRIVTGTLSAFAQYLQAGSLIEKDSAEARKRLMDATNALVVAQTKLNTELPKGRVNTDLLGEAAKRAAAQAQSFADGAKKMGEQAAFAALKVGESMKALDAELLVGKDYAEKVKLEVAFEKMQKAVEASQPPLSKLVQELAKLDGFKTIIGSQVNLLAAAAKEWEEIDDAAKAFGVTLREDVTEKFDKLSSQFDIIVKLYQEGKISAEEFARAQLKLAEASLDAAIKGGKSAEEIANIKGAVDRAKEALGSFTPAIAKVSENFRTFQGDLKATWVNLKDGLAESLVHFEGFGQLAKNVATSIRDAFAKYVVNEMLDQLASAVLKGKGLFQGLGDFVQNVFSSISRGLSSLFGTGASTAGGAAGAGAGGAAGSGSSAITGLTSVVGAVGSVVSAITGVLSFLSGRRMEQDIGRIEVTTRGMLNQLISLQETFNKWLPYLGGIQDAIRAGGGFSAETMQQFLDGIREALSSGLNEVVGLLQSVKQILLEIDTAVQFTAQKLGKPEWNVAVQNFPASQLHPAAPSGPIVNLQNSQFSSVYPQQLATQVSQYIVNQLRKA